MVYRMQTTAHSYLHLSILTSIAIIRNDDSDTTGTRTAEEVINKQLTLNDVSPQLSFQITAIPTPATAIPQVGH